ncbi:unnamed protein product, partial [Cuscuta epithymum]
MQQIASELALAQN